MKLIVDSGSTKTDWILSEDQQKWKIFNTVGYNPYFVDTENIYVSIRESLLGHLPLDKINEIYYYGAGCSSMQKRNIVEKALKRAFTGTKTIVVDHDLLAAARALLCKKSGFVSILGTGTNSCFYDGNQVTMNIDSLGYLLGDEGSGSSIGKKVLREYMRGFFDTDLKKRFIEKHLEENEDLFDQLYNAPLRNRYLASYASFAGENEDHPLIKRIVKEAFSDFFHHLVSKYPNYKEYEFNCLGTIGYIFQNILREVSHEYGMKVGIILQKPIEGLLKFHYEKN